MRFLDYGCEVSAICPRGHVLAYVPGMRRLYDYRSLDSLSSLEAAIERANPDMVIPCDDRVVWQLHELHARRPQLRPLIESSLGRASEYDIVARRDRLLETAQSLGVRIPETRKVLSESDVRDWFSRGPLRSVLKIDGTWGGNGVEIVDTEKQAVEAYARLSRPTPLAAAVKRWFINGDPLAFWGWRKQQIAPITIQRFVPGRPANAMVACWRGEAVASVIVEVLASQGSTGAGFVVRVVHNEEITRVAGLLAERLGLTGYYGLDFILDPESGAAHLIEMNPRCTQLGHLAVSEKGIWRARFTPSSPTRPSSRRRRSGATSWRSSPRPSRRSLRADTPGRPISTCLRSTPPSCASSCCRCRPIASSWRVSIIRSARRGARPRWTSSRADPQSGS